MLNLTCFSVYPTKDVSKQAAKKMIATLKPLIKSGVMVVNEQVEIEGRPYYKTVLNLNFVKEQVDLAETQKALQVLSKEWEWELKGVCAGRFTHMHDGKIIEFPLILGERDEEEPKLNTHFFIMGTSEEDVIHNLRAVMDRSFINFEITNAEEYHKIDDCFIVSATISLDDVPPWTELKRALYGLGSTKWSLRALEARATQCFTDDHIVSMRANFKDVWI